MSDATRGTIVDIVKNRYGAIAEGKQFGTCCGGAGGTGWPYSNGGPVPPA